VANGESEVQNATTPLEAIEAYARYEASMKAQDQKPKSAKDLGIK
jgi:hypothetical protein